MYHHAESPEVIRATLAQREQGIAAHYAQREVERLLTDFADPPAPHPMRLFLGRLHRFFQPLARMRDQPMT